MNEKLDRPEVVVVRVGDAANPMGDDESKLLHEALRPMVDVLVGLPDVTKFRAVISLIVSICMSTNDPAAAFEMIGEWAGEGLRRVEAQDRERGGRA